MKKPSQNVSRYGCFIPFAFCSLQNWPYVVGSINISPDVGISFFGGNSPLVVWNAFAVVLFGLFTCGGNKVFDLSIVALLFWFVCFGGSVLFGVCLSLFWTGLFCVDLFWVLELFVLLLVFALFVLLLVFVFWVLVGLFTFLFFSILFLCCCSTGFLFCSIFFFSGSLFGLSCSIFLFEDSLSFWSHFLYFWLNSSADFFESSTF